MRLCSLVLPLCGKEINLFRTLGLPQPWTLKQLMIMVILYVVMPRPGQWKKIYPACFSTSIDASEAVDKMFKEAFDDLLVSKYHGFTVFIHNSKGFDGIYSSGSSSSRALWLQCWRPKDTQRIIWAILELYLSGVLKQRCSC